MSFHISGVFPHMVQQAGTAKPRNELAVGPMMPWAGKLWFVSYVAHRGHGSGLCSLDKNLKLVRHPQSVSGTFANRMAHAPSDSVMVGPHLIDARGRVRTIKRLTEYRLAGCCRHLTDPDNKIHVLSMEGPFFEVDLHTLKVTEIANLTYELGLAKKRVPDWTGRARESVRGDFPQPPFQGLPCRRE